MEHTRRSFFGSAAGLLTAAPVVAGVVPHSVRLPMVEHLLLECPKRSTKWLQFKDWKVLWTGWKSDVFSLTVASQWVAVPADPNGNIRAGAIYVSTPGYFGVYRRGDMLNLEVRWPQPYLIDLKPDTQDAVMECEKRIGCALLVELMAGRGYPDWPPAVQFYANASRFLKEHDGVDLMDGRWVHGRDYEKLQTYTRDLLGRPE